MRNYQITAFCHHFIQQHVSEGDLCIDATMGNGHDTLLLCQLVGSSGHVLGFDIQEAALLATKKRLQEASVYDRATLIRDGHQHMEKYTDPGTVSCIVFNLGYLPSGDHTISTKSDSTLKALQASLALLKRGGIISLCVYSGGDSGFKERDAVLAFLRSLDPRAYLVVVSEYYNRPNHPPIPVLIHKL